MQVKADNTEDWLTAVANYMGFLSMPNDLRDFALQFRRWNPWVASQELREQMRLPIEPRW